MGPGEGGQPAGFDPASLSQSELEDRAGRVTPGTQDAQRLLAEIDRRVVEFEHEMLSIEHGELSGRLRGLSPAEQARILDHLEVHAPPFAGRELTEQDLAAAGLGPRLQIEIADVGSIAVSDPYALDADGRIAVTAYVPQEGGRGWIARSYYLSNSHGQWKYLPNYRPAADEQRIEWYGKGHSQPSIALPIALQRGLAELSARVPARSVNHPDFLFGGTARRWDPRRLQDSFVAEVGQTPTFLPGQLIAPLDDRVRARGQREHVYCPPSDLRLSSPADAPDLRRSLTSYQQRSTLYGSITIEVVPSANAQYLYQFARDRLGRVWIAGVENRSELTSQGLRSTWVDAGDLTTPAFEYSREAGAYGNRDHRSGNYVDMWKHYLRHVPLIQDYVHSRRIKTP